MPAYRDWARNASAKYDAAATAAFNGAIAANRHSDNFLLLTVIFAAVSFLGGMSTKMRYPQHLVIIIVGTIALIYGMVRIAALPFL